ncbi:upstream stimulatory factor 1 isoform X2 [Prionailurus bengalensis]|uniref:upstream stimulatory factor 1 isoform X2 n=1 Tax=Prionailurus bengalensis TaxID=37029 RepID=UPI001CA96548|nr:upstream stimulatory factor 1 isoform X2 [Prionailurus bengalensis]
MYRVIQVSEGQLDGQTEGTGAISGYPATQSMTQAVIQGAFTSDDTVDAEGTAAETHYTYFPSTAVGDGAAGTTSGSAAAVVTTQGSEALLGQATPPGTGQFFVMMSPQEVLQGGSQRSIAPRTHPYSPKSEAPRTTRDEKRRAQHNEVERRRRDKINNWIVQLSKIIPDCSMESTKSGQSKGGILSKACDYIQELRQSNHRLSEELQGLDQLQLDNDVLRQQSGPHPLPLTSGCLKKVRKVPTFRLNSPHRLLSTSGGRSQKQEPAASSSVATPRSRGRH